MQQLLGDAGPPPEGAFVCQLFLQRMPPSVRMVLASASTTLTLPQLAEMADRIVEVTNPPTVAPVTASQSTMDLQQLTDNLTRLIAALDTSISRSRDSFQGSSPSRPSSHSSSRPSSRPSSRQQSRLSSPSGLCWYHRRFGPNARKCRPPCAHLGNDQASY